MYFETFLFYAIVIILLTWAAIKSNFQVAVLFTMMAMLPLFTVTGELHDRNVSISSTINSTYEYNMTGDMGIKQVDYLYKAECLGEDMFWIAITWFAILLINIAYKFPLEKLKGIWE